MTAPAIQTVGDDSDASKTGPVQSTSAATTIALQRKADADRQLAAAALNQRAPQPTLDAVTREPIYRTAPTPVPQFASPLALIGTPYVVAGKRVVTSGSGDARQTITTDGSSTPRQHSGLDFRAPVGEDILACDAGTCAVTIQIRHGAPINGPLTVDGVRIKDAHADPATGNIIAEVDGHTRILVPRAYVGHGGLYVSVSHQSPHQNYVTQYMHLSSVSVKHGQKVALGAVLGKVGRSGGNSGITDGPHLHWQVRFLGTVVRPEPLVPHHRPGYPDEAGGPGGYYVTSQGPLPAGQQAVNSQAAAHLTASDRSTTLANQSPAHLREAGAQHASDSSRRALTAAAAVYEAVAKYQVRLPVVDNAMTFDFERGVWSNGVGKEGTPL